jgi:hypothetical protein
MPVPTRESRLDESRGKIHPPFRLDETMRFYSPQENVMAFRHPRVRAWLEWIENEWWPPGTGRDRIALLLPCTKQKPYPISREHRAINAALLAHGWSPLGPTSAPSQLVSELDDGEPSALLDVTALRRDAFEVDRIVVSEPLALVPYTEVYRWRGAQSPASSYDDPGLFEARGTSVSPWLAGCTAVQREDGSWAWGAAEREAYLDAHDRLRQAIGRTLVRVRGRYRAIVAWVSPGLTHRSFLTDRGTRRAEGLPLRRTGLAGLRDVRGVLDDHPGLLTILPNAGQLAQARERLRGRIIREGRPATPGAVRAIYARGDGADTPLGLPETLVFLTSHLEAVTGHDS